MGRKPGSLNRPSHTNHIKRPMNAFMAWSKQQRRLMVEEGTSLNNSAMSRVLGERWKNLDESEKKTWKRTAERLKKEHAKVCLTLLSMSTNRHLKPNGPTNQLT